MLMVLKQVQTKIKSRSVDIGLVESVTLDSNFSRVIIKARLDNEK